jgi:isoamylase
LSWINWELDDEGRELLAFTRRLVSLRRAYPTLRRGRFMVGQYNEELGVKDVAWLSPNGEEMTQTQWQDRNARCLGMLMDGRAQPTGIRRSGSDATLLLILNAYHDVVNFTLPEVAQGKDWICLVDTNQPQSRLHTHFPFGSEFVVTGRSLLLFELHRR